MMSSTTCANCGAEIAAGAKFCRRCGRPHPASGAANRLEAETRTFGAQAQYATPTQHVEQKQTGPSYLAPHGATPLQAPTTRSLEPTGQKRKLLLLVGLIVAALVLAPLALFVIYKTIQSRTATPSPPVVSPPGKPGTDRGGTTSTGDALFYPGAETVMDMTGKDGNRVLQLRTKDSQDKVVEWYVEKLKPTENMKIPGEKVTVLRGDKIRAVITANDTQTDIIIKQGDGE